MKKLLTLGAVLLTMATSTFAEGVDEQARLAQEKADKLLTSTNMTPLTYEDENGNTIGYAQGVYGEELAGDYALVIFLHGAGERGNFIGKHLIHGVPDMTTYIKENKIKAVVIAPQCPLEQQWVNTPWSEIEHTMDAEPSESMTLAIELLNSKMAEFKADKSRIYATGISMGGYGTWDIISRNPQLFAAAVPICGGGDVKQAVKLKDMPLLIFHGDRDTVVPTKNSQNMYQALLDAGSDKATYIEVENCEHGSWFPAYADVETFNWLFNQKK